jgi:hypothetical protein
MPPKRTIRNNERVENIKTLRAAAQQQLRELRSDLKKAGLPSRGRGDVSHTTTGRCHEAWITQSRDSSSN